MCIVMCNWRMVALPNWLRSHLRARTQKDLPVLSGVGSSPEPRMWEVINSCRNVSAMPWNPAKRHDESEKCFLGHPVSFDFVVPIGILSKHLYPSMCWLCPLSFCDLVTLAIQLIFQKSQLHQISLTCYINGLLAPSVDFSTHWLQVLSWSWTLMRDLQRGLCPGMLDWSWFFFFPSFVFTLAGLIIFLVSSNTGAAFLHITRLLFQQVLYRSEVLR